MRLSELGIIGGLELDRTDPCFHLEPLGTIGDAFVERLVELAAGIEDNGGFGITRLNEGCGQQHASECGGGPRKGHDGLLSEWPICSIDYPSHRVREQTDQCCDIIALQTLLCSNRTSIPAICPTRISIDGSKKYEN